MSENQNSIDQLIEKLNSLMKRQDSIQREISELRGDLIKLKVDASKDDFKEKEKHLAAQMADDIKAVKEKYVAEHQPKHGPVEAQDFHRSSYTVKNTPFKKSNLEKFIGENLINKIGIVITVIGVGIGAKYAIDHELINPLTRIILGYLVGLGLLGFAIRLKNRYEKYSAVLLSGSMAILYFISYAAYSFYGLFPQALVYILMVLFTVYTVFAAIKYNRQVIAIMGLVGAYAVPFLLYGGFGNEIIFLIYISIINIGILAIAVIKYWKPLYYISFIFTWMIYFSWFIFEFEPAQHFTLALTFLTLFFTTFYLIFLSYKLIKKERFNWSDIVLLLANSFLFFGFGYAIFDNHTTGNQMLGLFTLANAIIHFVVGVIVYRQKLADRNLFYLVTGLVLVFITIAIPVQLNGSWVTILWAGEAALLFWIGRSRKISFYEILAYPLMFLAFFSIAQDWSTAYHTYEPDYPESRITFLFNINFLSSLLVIASFAIINIIHRNKKYVTDVKKNTGLFGLMTIAIPALFLLVLYNSFLMEIITFWDQLYTDSGIKSLSNAATGDNPQQFDPDLLRFKTVWILNYSMIFLAALSFLNILKIKSHIAGLTNLVLNVVMVAIFLGLGLFTLGALRESYLNQSLAEYYHHGVYNIWIRYISLGFLAVLMFACYKYIRLELLKVKLSLPFDLLLHITILWVASSELVNWLEIFGSKETFKLGLSILWGVYALLLISLGIWKKKKHLRIAAILLFAITLIKLFFYDISNLDTISKTIIFVLLGILLLIISFLYNKYKHFIFDKSED